MSTNKAVMHSIRYSTVIPLLVMSSVACDARVSGDPVDSADPNAWPPCGSDDWVRRAVDEYCAVRFECWAPPDDTGLYDPERCSSDLYRDIRRFQESERTNDWSSWEIRLGADWCSGGEWRCEFGGAFEAGATCEEYRRRREQIFDSGYPFAIHCYENDR